MWLQINVFYGQIRALTDGDIVADHFTAVCNMLKEGAPGAYRHHRGHVLPRPGLAFLYDRPVSGAGRPDHAAAGYAVPLAGAAGDASDNIDAGQWNALLRAAAGITRIGGSTRTGITPQEVACFLLANRAFPRSVGLNLGRVERHLTQLRTSYGLRGMSAALERLDQLIATMTYQNVTELAARDLSPFLDFVQREIGGLHQDIVETFGG